ncbi:kirola-like [Sesamum indicum]|uniref:Kirola-like n=1 Tax=Sesamum indicum TaxID=4182 RepID=A0A6I9STR4_SESIN|nr:kirola-like [Sesamum indicum]
MGLDGKLVSQISIKADGGLFFHLFKYKLHHTMNICPQKIQTLNLVDGQWGTVGSVITSNFTADGEKFVAKVVIEAVDEEKRSITYKVIEGDLMVAYNTFKVTFCVDSKGELDNVVTWTIEYEKKNESVPEPSKFLDFCSNATQEIERHYMLLPN